MKTSRKSHGIIGIICLGILGLSSSFAEMQTWKSKSGTELKAEFVEMKDGLAVLKTETGKTMAISPDRLDEDSKNRIMALTMSAEQGTRCAFLFRSRKIINSTQPCFKQVLMAFPNSTHHRDFSTLWDGDV